MISIRVEKRRGKATVRFRVTAPSIERALEIAGEDAREGPRPRTWLRGSGGVRPNGPASFPTTK
jgi:hypothetical protein